MQKWFFIRCFVKHLIQYIGDWKNGKKTGILKDNILGDKMLYNDKQNYPLLIFFNEKIED